MIHRKWVQQGSCLLVGFLVIGVLSSLVVQAQQDLPTEQRRKPIYFRRVYVPASDLDKLIQGTMPLKRKSFVDMVEAINRSARDALTSSEVRVVSAKYSARLVGDDLIDGKALLEIEKPTGEPALLPLSPSGLAWGRPQWEAATALPAVAGMDGTGRWFVLVEKSGTLRIPWSLQGMVASGNRKQFDFWIPPSSTSRLEVQLPEQTVLSSGHGFVSAPPELPKTETNRPDRSSNSPASEGVGSDGLAAGWIVELGGQQRTLLTVTPRQTFQPRDALVFFRQSSNYVLSRTGVDLDVELHVDVHHQPIRQLKLRLDGGLRLLTAQLGKEQLRWTTQETAEGDQVTLHFPKLLSGADRVISFKTTAPLVSGEEWKLPAIRMTEGVWREEQANVTLSDDLILVKLQTEGCHETAIASGMSTTSGESRLFQFYQPQAWLEVVLKRRLAGVHLDVGTRIDLALERMSGLVVADATAGYGQQFVLEGKLASGWIVDAVETDPPGFLDDYEVVRSPQPTKSGPSARQRRLIVRLNRAIQKDQNVRIVVRGHARVTQGKVDGSRLRMVDFHLNESKRAVVAVGLESGFQLRVTRDLRLQRLETDEVQGAIADALDLDSTTLLFLDKPDSGRMFLQLYREQTRYSSEIHVQALFGPGRLEEQYHITCTPENAPLRRLLVHFYRPRGLPMQWTVQGDPAAKLVARRLDRDEQELRRLSGGETWEVTLEQSRLESFQLLGVRNVQVEESAQICLAAMPESVSQFGSLALLVPDAADLKIENDQLKRIPAAPQPVGRTAQIRGVYDYDPSQDLLLRVTRRQPSSSQDSLWVWDCQLQSRFMASGYTTHRAVYRLENKGALHFKLRLPAGAELQELMVDREVIGLVGTQRDEKQLEVPLPLQSRFPVVRISYAVQSPRLRIFAGLKAPLPKVECAVLHTQWRVLLPPGYALFTRDVVEEQRLSIGKRLFGPLYRSSDAKPFRLLALGDWQQIRGPSPDQTDIRQRADACVRRLGRSFQLAQRQTVSRQEIAWDDVLENYLREQNSLANPEFENFWIDQAALSGTESHLRIETSLSEAEALEVGRKLLRRAQLSLLVSNKSAVLTTRSRMPETATVSRTEEKSVVQLVEIDRLASRIRRASASEESPWVELQQWFGETQSLTSPWISVSQNPDAQISDSRWSRHDFALKPGDVSSIVVCRPLVLHSFAWAGLLIWAGLLTWLFYSRPERLVPVILFSGFVALLAPSNIYPGPTCLFLGSLLAGLMVLTWRHTRAVDVVRGAPSELSFEVRPIPQALVSILVFIGLTTLAIWTWADETDGRSTKDVDQKTTQVGKVFRLLIPVDENKKPVGQYDYLPEAFFDELHRRVEETSHKKSGWLATEAEYRAECDWVAVRNGQESPAFVVTIKLAVLNPQQTVQIQVPRETVELTAAELNGEEIPINWSVEGDALLVEIEDAGAYTLQYHLRPNIRSVDGKRAVQFNIPKIPSTRLRFPDSVEMPEISVLKSWGTVRRQLPAGDLVAELGGCGQLGFTWTWEAPAQEFTAQTGVEQMTWINVRPHSIVIDAKFRFSVLRGKVEQVQLRVDPRLRMLPLPDGQPVRKPPRVREGDINVIHVELTEPMDRDFTLEMKFYMDKTSGVGQLQLPTLEAIADRVMARQLGVTISEKLQWETSPLAESQQMTQLQFAQRWGTDILPHLALRLPAIDVGWSLKTRRRVAETVASQQLDIEVGAQRLTMTCEMEINTTGSSVFQHRFQFPKQFQVKQVFLSREDQRLPIRIAVSSDQKLTVFLTEGVIGKQHLRVEGEWPHNGKTATIPRLEMETGKILTRRVRVFRKPEILVQFDGNPEDVQLSNGESGRFQAALGRLVVDWEESLDGAKPKQGQLMLKLRPNQRRLRGSSVTQVFRKEAAWWAAIDCHVNVLNGVCDELQLDIPESWTGVFQLTPAMPFEVKRLPGIPQRRMIIRPETAMTGDFRVRIESPLLLPAGGIRVPEILPLGMQRTASYVVMPNHLDQQKLAWETSGLQRIASLPETMATGVITSDSTVARVVSTHFRAHIKEVQQIKTDPFIHLVDVRLGWTAEGECSGVTTFDLEPAGRTECVLRVPPQYQLIAVRVAGLPGALTELEAGRFSLQLGPSQLAQRIEVVFRGQIVIRTAVVKRVKTATPTIEDFPVGRTLWTVRALNSIGSGRYQNDEGAATSEQQAALQRLNTIAAMVETATENRSELTGQRINDWFLHWERRFTSVESSWNRWRAATAGTEQESSLLETVDRYHQLKRRLGVDGAGRRDDQQLPQAAGAEEVWETVVTGTDILSDFEGQQTDLDLVYPGIPRSSDFGLRLLVALGIFFIAGVGWKLKRMGSLGEWWARWPYVTGVCVGLGWWLWLSPSLLGLVIMAVSSIAALVPSWAPLPLPQANSEAKTITDFPRLR